MGDDLKENSVTNAQNNTEPECSSTFNRVIESELVKSTEAINVDSMR